MSSRNEIGVEEIRSRFESLELEVQQLKEQHHVPQPPAAAHSLSATQQPCSGQLYTSQLLFDTAQQSYVGQQSYTAQPSHPDLAPSHQQRKPQAGTGVAQRTGQQPRIAQQSHTGQVPHTAQSSHPGQTPSQQPRKPQAGAGVAQQTEQQPRTAQKSYTVQSSHPGQTPSQQPKKPQAGAGVAQQTGQAPWYKKLWPMDRSSGPDPLQELEEAKQTIRDRDADVERLEQHLKDKEEELERLKKQFYSRKQRREGHYPAAEGRRHDKLKDDYAHLFLSSASPIAMNLSKSGTMEPMKAKRLMGHIFEVAYEECKTATLLLICGDIFAKHNGTDADREILQQKMEAFGDLLLSKPEITKECDMGTILPKVSKRILEFYELSKDENASSLQAFMNDAVSLAWKMVTLQPPMVIDVQQEFDEDHHDRQSHYWIDDLPSDQYPMQYFRPTLFRSCMGELAEKAWVGNHPKKSTHKNLKRKK